MKITAFYCAIFFIVPFYCFIPLFYSLYPFFFMSKQFGVRSLTSLQIEPKFTLFAGKRDPIASSFPVNPMPVFWGLFATVSCLQGKGTKKQMQAGLNEFSANPALVCTVDNIKNT
jgi:hypothetical protein